MKHGSLFSGIGGFDLAAEWMGWENVFHCEWMPFPRKILSHYWPDAISYHDITTTDFRQHAGQIDILTGGFPCQPYSAAGKRKGKDDDRHLWPHMLRCIREVKPRWVVGENVFGIATWNGGLVFEEVCAELEAEGYAVQPFVLPAAAVNAPHRRDRVWFVAYRDLHGLKQRNGDDEEYASQGGQHAQRDTQQGDGDGDAADASTGNAWQGSDTSQGSRKCVIERREAQSSGIISGQDICQRIKATQCGECGNIQELRNANATDATNCRYRRRNGERCADGRERVLQDECGRGKMGCQIAGCCGEWDAANAESAGSERQCKRKQRQIQPDRRNSGTVPANWQDFPTQSPICGGDDGLPAQLDGITFPKWRAESIKGYGNAIVPQVALRIFKAIQHYEAL